MIYNGQQFHPSRMVPNLEPHKQAIIEPIQYDPKSKKTRHEVIAEQIVPDSRLDRFINEDQDLHEAPKGTLLKVWNGNFDIDQTK